MFERTNHTLTVVARHSRAYDEGRAARLRSPDPEDNSNPYDTYMHQHDQWELGWVEADDEDEK